MLQLITKTFSFLQIPQDCMVIIFYIFVIGFIFWQTIRARRLNRDLFFSLQLPTGKFGGDTGLAKLIKCLKKLGQKEKKDIFSLMEIQVALESLKGQREIVSTAALVMQYLPDEEFR